MSHNWQLHPSGGPQYPVPNVPDFLKKVRSNVCGPKDAQDVGFLDRENAADFDRVWEAAEPRLRDWAGLADIKADDRKALVRRARTCCWKNEDQPTDALMKDFGKCRTICLLSIS